MVRRARVLLAAAAAGLAPSALALAQTPAFRGGDVVVANDRPTPALYRVTASGNQRIAIGQQLSGLAGVTTTRLGELVVADHASGKVVLVPPVGASRLLGVVPGGLRATEDIDGSFLITSFRSRSVVRVTRNGNVSTVFSLPAPTRPYDVVVDSNGDYVYCNDLGSPKGVFRVDRRTLRTTPIYTGSGLPLAHGLAWFGNGDLAVIDGIRDEVYRIDRTTGNLSVFVSRSTLGNNPDSITESGDGGFLVALESTSVGFSVVHVDGAGKLRRVGGGAPFSNLEEVAVVASWTGPTNLATGPNASYPMRIELPAHPGRPYLIGLSGGMFPGLQLPGRARAFSVIPDGLFQATLARGLPPILMRWRGALDASGTARPIFDLRVLSPGALAGLTLFAQGFAVDFTAPSGIAAITNPLRFDFR